MVKPLPINNKIRGARRFAAPNSIYFRTWFAQQQRKDRKEANSRLLLDNYPGAAAAYSLRDLTNNWYSKPVIRVRRSIDNLEKDFTSFDIEEGYLTAFCGTGDGLVTTWYDQSGNGNDATQTTAASQPRIVDAGVLVMENGKAALEFVSSSTFLVATQAVDKPALAYIAVFNQHNQSGLQKLIGCFEKNSSEWAALYADSGRIEPAIDNNGNKYTVLGDLLNTDTDYLAFMSYNAANGDLFSAIDGEIHAQRKIDSYDMIEGIEPESIGANSILNREFFIGTIKEIIFYPTDQSANREAIEANINAHYGIF